MRLVSTEGGRDRQAEEEGANGLAGADGDSGVWGGSWEGEGGGHAATGAGLGGPGSRDVNAAPQSEARRSGHRGAEQPAAGQEVSAGGVGASWYGSGAAGNEVSRSQTALRNERIRVRVRVTVERGPRAKGQGPRAPAVGARGTQ